jgi:hypothetical protein
MMHSSSSLAARTGKPVLVAIGSHALRVRSHGWNLYFASALPEE